MTMATLTLGWLTLAGATPLQVIEAGAAAGFSSVSLRVAGRKLGETFPGAPASMDEAGHLRSVADEKGIAISNASTYHLAADVTLDDLRLSVGIAAALGAEMIVANCMDPDRKRWTALMRRYCALAGEMGIRIGFEFMPFSEVKTLGAAERAIEAVGVPNLGVIIDALHLARSGGTPEDVRQTTVPIFLAQLCDAPAVRPASLSYVEEARQGRLEPGAGGLPLDALIDALPPGLEIEMEVPSLHEGGSPWSRQASSIRASALAFLGRHFTGSKLPNPYR
jgi:sugar phosphate isomerase/epimerase